MRDRERARYQLKEKNERLMHTCEHLHECAETESGKSERISDRPK